MEEDEEETGILNEHDVKLIYPSHRSETNLWIELNSLIGTDGANPLKANKRNKRLKR